jgi:hypothetical protein
MHNPAIHGTNIKSNLQILVVVGVDFKNMKTYKVISV